jgi:hypothetical protein
MAEPAEIVTARQLVKGPRSICPHVVLLGAGASRAAFPNGDAAGQRIPVMDDLVDVIGLQPLIERAGFDIQLQRNFEVIYGELLGKPGHARTVQEIEQRIVGYFSGLSLPDEATIYDRLLISLRPTDAVFTFNWDPFLFDAYQRNHIAVPLPEIFFLHGNVRIGACLDHDTWGARNGRCRVCKQRFSDVPLLYPIRQKNYSANPYIQRNWGAAKTIFSEAFTITIFGYGAPESDTDAVKLLQTAWFQRSKRDFEHIEIIDIASLSHLHNRWSPFSPTLHYHVTTAFEQCRITRWPRRSCESLVVPMIKGVPCEDFPLPVTSSLAELQSYAADIAQHEEY